MRTLLVLPLAVLSIVAAVLEAGTARGESMNDPYVELAAAQAYRAAKRRVPATNENRVASNAAMSIVRNNASTLTIITNDLGEEENRVYSAITQQRLPNGAVIVIAEGSSHAPFDGSRFVRSGLAAGLYRFNASAVYENSAKDWGPPLDVKVP